MVQLFGITIGRLSLGVFSTATSIGLGNHFLHPFVSLQLFIFHLDLNEKIEGIEIDRRIFDTYIRNIGQTNELVRSMINTEEHHGDFRRVCSDLIDHSGKILRVIAHVEVSDQTFTIGIFSENVSALFDCFAHLILAIGLVHLHQDALQVLQSISLRFTTALRNVGMSDILVELKDLLVEDQT